MQDRSHSPHPGAAVPSARSAKRDVPDRRGEVGDEPVVTRYGLDGDLADVLASIDALTSAVIDR